MAEAAELAERGRSTTTSAGLAEMPSTTGQMLSVPLTSTLPVVAASRQSTWTETGVVAWAVTSNGAEPAHCAFPPTDVADSADREKPLPAGSPPMTLEIVELCVVSKDPARVKLPGPVIEYETVLIEIPGAASSARLTEPSSALPWLVGAQPNIPRVVTPTIARSGVRK